MSETKHTPGPWHYNAGGGAVHTTEAVPTEVVASFVDEWNGPLIAAAPDLFAALAALRNAADPVLGRAYVDALKDADAAIAKAESR